MNYVLKIQVSRKGGKGIPKTKYGKSKHRGKKKTVFGLVGCQQTLAGMMKEVERLRRRCMRLALKV